MNKKDWEGNINIIRDIFAHHDKFPVIDFLGDEKSNYIYQPIILYPTDLHGFFEVRAQSVVFRYNWEDLPGKIWCDFHTNKKEPRGIAKKNIYDAAINAVHVLNGIKVCEYCTVPTIPWKNIFQNTRKRALKRKLKK